MNKNQAKNFVDMMLKSSKEKKVTESQSRTHNVDQKTTEKLLKEIQEKLQQK